MNRDNDKGKILIGRTLVWVGVQFAMLLLIIVRLYYLQVYQADSSAPWRTKTGFRPGC